MPKATQCLNRCYKRPKSELRCKLPNRLVEWDRRFTWLWRPPSSHFRWDRSLNAKKITDISHIPTRHDRLLNHPSMYLCLRLHCITALKSNVWCLNSTKWGKGIWIPVLKMLGFINSSSHSTDSVLFTHESRSEILSISANLYRALVSFGCPYSLFDWRSWSHQLTDDLYKSSVTIFARQP